MPSQFTDPLKKNSTEDRTFGLVHDKQVLYL